MSDSTVPVYEWEDQDKYELLAWVKASDRRVDIITLLNEAPKNTNDFAGKWDVELETVRYHLGQMQNGGPDGTFPPLVKILTPQLQQYRLWGLTETGEELTEYL